MIWFDAYGVYLELSLSNPSKILLYDILSTLPKVRKH